MKAQPRIQCQALQARVILSHRADGWPALQDYDRRARAGSYGLCNPLPAGRGALLAPAASWIKGRCSLDEASASQGDSADFGVSSSMSNNPEGSTGSETPGARLRAAVASEPPPANCGDHQRLYGSPGGSRRLPGPLSFGGRSRERLLRSPRSGHHEPERCLRRRPGASSRRPTCRSWWMPTPVGAAPFRSPARSGI